MDKLTEHQAKALDYTKHISLTANAGSGKTFVLSKRYLKIVTEENIPLRNIAAITFTDKAAGELYKKIAKQIDERIKESKNDNEINKLENIRRQLVSANISTIHSFCGNILREYPVEAELDANFSAIDEQTSNEFIELSVEEMIKSSIKNNGEAEKLKYLIRLFASKGLFAGEIGALIKERRNVLASAKNIYNKSENEIGEFLHNTFLERFEKIFGGSIHSLINDIGRINNSVLSEKPSNIIAVDVKNRLENLTFEKINDDIINRLLEIRNLILKKDGFIKVKDYLSSKLRDRLNEEAGNVEDFFFNFSFISVQDNSLEIELELAKFGKTVIFFFNKALEIYEKKKTVNGYLDYEDILLHTKKVLENENVRKDISEKFKYIMIDEYQDTSELQYNIFLPILEYLKKGNLFVVGDEKQSIYMFRDAELEVFDLTKRNIEDVSGSNSLLTLPDSFRMAPSICLFTNLLFKNLFNNPNLLYNEVKHSDLVCARDDNFEGKIEFLINEVSDEVENNDDIQEDNREEELIAKRILKLIHQNNLPEKISWGDIAILSRKRKAFAALEKVFVKYKIPFLIIGGKGFYQRQTIYDIYNYFSFLSDEKNDTALVGILRSPFFSLSDSAIFEISILPGENFWQKLIRYSLSRPEAERVVKTLKENLSLSNSYNVSLLLRKILNESEFLSVVASKPNGVQELANVEKLIKLTINFFSKGFKTLYDYVSFLKDSIEQSEDEAQAAVAEESDSVKIMTLHQAKGLEFPVVFLCKCNETAMKSSVKAKSITANKNFGLLTKVPLNNRYSSKYEAAPIVGINNFIVHKKEFAEIKRLLYVGITRAQNYLFISASIKPKKKYESDSFIGLIIKGFGIDLTSTNFTINSELKFLLRGDNGYSYSSRDVTAEIPIIKKIEQADFAAKTSVESLIQKKLELNKIVDFPKGEIISATKLSVYKQCPLKYHLTYDQGFSPLYNKFKKWQMEKRNFSGYEFNKAEDDNLAQLQENIPERSSKEHADVKGRIIHKILQMEVEPENNESSLDNLLKLEFNSFDEGQPIIQKLKQEIMKELSSFYESPEYKDLKNYKNYHNEFEIYSKENDYFIYGIIDKLIIENDKAIIVDFKTDTIDKNEFGQRIDTYLTQLSFYSYIVSKLYPEISKFELRLIFIKYPDKSFIKEVDSEVSKNTKLEIEKMVKAIRKQNYIKNLDHCSKCSFSIDFKNCIID